MGRAELLIIIAVIAAVLLVNYGLGVLLKTSVPLAVVSSWSMEPVLHVGDLIVAQGGVSVNRGDVVLYQVDGRYIVHRVVGSVNGVCYITKGDANAVPDPRPVCDGQVKGRVILVIPYIGVVKLALERLLGH